MRELERELKVTSEEGLDKALKDMDYKMSHESMPLAEEKKMVSVRIMQEFSHAIVHM